MLGSDGEGYQPGQGKLGNLVATVQAPRQASQTVCVWPRRGIGLLVVSIFLCHIRLSAVLPALRTVIGHHDNQGIVGNARILQSLHQHTKVDIRESNRGIVTDTADVRWVAVSKETAVVHPIPSHHMFIRWLQDFTWARGVRTGAAAAPKWARCCFPARGTAAQRHR